MRSGPKRLQQCNPVIEVITMDKNEKPNIEGDRLNVLLLTFLAVLQFIPRCMSEAIQLILQKRNVSYADQVRSTNNKAYIRNPGPL